MITTTESVTLDRADLSRALKTAGKATPKNPVMPILACVRLLTENGELAVTGASEEMYATERVPCEGEVAACLPLADLARAVAAVKDEEVRLSCDGDLLTLRWGKRGKTTFPVYALEDYPKLTTPDDAVRIALPSALLQGHLPLLAGAVSTDALRPAMGGVLLEDGVLVATNGHVLAAVQTGSLDPFPKALEGDFQPFTLPPNALATALQGTEENVVIEKGREGYARITNGDVTVGVRIIGDPFPNWRAVLPLENDKTLTVDREALLGAVQRASLAASSFTHQAKLTITPSSVTVSAEDIERRRDFEEKVPCEWDGPTVFAIGFNSQYLSFILSGVPGETAEMKFSSPNRAVLFAAGNVRALVMPVVLSNTYA